MEAEYTSTSACVKDVPLLLQITIPIRSRRSEQIGNQHEHTEEEMRLASDPKGSDGSKDTGVRHNCFRGVAEKTGIAHIDSKWFRMSMLTKGVPLESCRWESRYLIRLNSEDRP